MTYFIKSPLTKLLLLVGLLLNLSVAQAIGWKNVMPNLTDEDLDLIDDITRDKMVDQPVGTTMTWENPKSGHYGSVTLKLRFTEEDAQCFIHQHYLKTRAREPWEINITTCRLPDGKWVWQVHHKEALY